MIRAFAFNVFVFVLIILSSAYANELGRVAVILHGETFRVNSHQGSREIGEGGIEAQAVAARSHVEKIFEPLVWDMGYSGVDVYIGTEASAWEPHLVDGYGPWAAKGKHITDEGQPHLRSVMSVGLHDLIILTRPDTVLKPTFPCALKAANKTQVLFIFQCWKALDRLGSGRDRITDTMAVIPAWAFPILSDSVSAGVLINHDAMDYMVPKVGLENVGYILPHDQHDSDPQKDWNPLYTFAGRPEGGDVNSVNGVYPWIATCPGADQVFIGNDPKRPWGVPEQAAAAA